MRSLENSISLLFLLITSLFISKTSEAQVGEYDLLKSQYDRLIREHKLDSALFVAKQMNYSALQNEGDTSLNYAVSYRYIGNCFDDINERDSALFFWNKSILVLKAQNRSESISAACCYNNIGLLYIDIGEYDHAEFNYKKASEIYKNVLNEEHPEYANSLNNLGILYWEMGDYKSAESYYIQASEIQKNALGYEHPDYARSLNNLGILYAIMGDYKNAAANYQQALEIKICVLGDEYSDYANGLNNLGCLYWEMGDYKTAEQYHKQALEIYEKVQFKDQLGYTNSLNNLGLLYADLGAYSAAERILKQSLEIRKRVLGDEHPDYALSLNNLGALYSNMGNYKSAERYYKRALVIYTNAFGKEHLSYAYGLFNLGNLFLDLNDFKAAERYFKRALDIYGKILGKNHIDYASSLMNLGILYWKINELNSSELYLKKAIEIQKKALGYDHPDYANGLNNLAVLYTEVGNFKSAGFLINEFLKIRKLNLIKNFSWLSADEKTLFWQQEKDFFNNINGFSVQAFDQYHFSSELSYVVNLFSKSLLLETSLELDKAITNSADPLLLDQFNEMKQLRRIVSKMQSEGSDKKELLDRYSAQADSLDKILVNQLGEYAAAKRKFEITWVDVQNSLSSSDAAIEFASYYDEKDNTTKYMALVVRSDYEYPKLVKIGSEPEIKESIQMKDFSTLYSLVWQGIDSLLEGANKVYYSPDGELNNLSFSGLYHRNNGSDSISYLIDRYDLHQLTTTRYLADGTLKKQKPFEASAALLGGIDYNQIPSIDATSKREESNEDYLLQLNLDKEIQQSRSSNFSSMMPPLKGTEIEVKTISGLLNHSGWNTTSYTGQSAGENQIKYDLLQKSPGVLHIATHGFAFPDIVKKETDLIQMNEKSSYKASEDPMVRCGLMLSGSNISWAGDPKKMIEQTGDDGILTAAEVANMDLTNTKLVVLSACETGLGKIEGSEGTFGLKRAFKLAGVEQLIVSLWSVPDKETMELMTLFYTDLSLTKDPVVSFQKAQREMRYRYPTEPEKWAGFVLVR